MMNVRYIMRGVLWLMFATSLLFGTMGCSERAEDEPMPERPTNKCVLMLHTGIIEQSRAANEISPQDMIRTLRTIIVRPNGKVEHNDFVDFGNHPQSSCYRIFEVEPENGKRIYFIANEGGANEDLTSSLTNFSKDKVNDLVFTLKADAEAIPMSSVYEINIPKQKERVEEEMYVVRAATKISYRFINHRLSAVTVNSIDVNSIAENMYLLPHVNEPDLKKDFDNEPLPWIEWLKKVADESQDLLQENPTLIDPPLADYRGWIKEYDISTEIHSPYNLPMNINLPASMKEDASPILSKEYYMHESKHNLSVERDQQYTMTFHLTEHLADGTSKDIELEKDFNNLKALFRNTHVLVDVEIASEIVVRVIPYAECKLEPVFGLTVTNKNQGQTTK